MYIFISPKISKSICVEQEEEEGDLRIIQAANASREPRVLFNLILMQ
jgi:hypothetical protein